MEACASCPNRHLAALAKSIGDEDLSNSIEAAGCEWWWWKWPTDKLGNPIGEPQRVCGRAHLVEHMKAMGKLITAATQEIHDDRHEQDKAVSQVEQEVQRLGLPAVLQSLAGLGTRAFLGRQIAAQLEKPVDDSGS